MGRRRPAGFADADAESRDEQLDEVLRRPAQHCHRAPDSDGEGDDIAPVPEVGPAGDGNAERGVDKGEGEARQHAELAVAELQVFNDVCRQDIDYLAVDEIENVNDREQPQYEIAVSGLAVGVGDCLLRVGQC